MQLNFAIIAQRSTVSYLLWYCTAISGHVSMIIIILYRRLAYMQGLGDFFKMAADLEFFKHLYLCSLTSYGLITGLADFSFTEQCYWYLQSALNPCLKAAPLSVEKPDFPDFLQILFLSLRRAIPVLSEPLEGSTLIFTTRPLKLEGCGNHAQ